MSDAQECRDWLLALAKEYAPLADYLGMMKFNKTLTSGATVSFTFKEPKPVRARQGG